MLVHTPNFWQSITRLPTPPEKWRIDEANNTLQHTITDTESSKHVTFRIALTDNRKVGQVSWTARNGTYSYTHSVPGTIHLDEEPIDTPLPTRVANVLNQQFEIVWQGFLTHMERDQFDMWQYLCEPSSG